MDEKGATEESAKFDWKLPPTIISSFIGIYVIVLIYINSVGLPKILSKYGDFAYYSIVIFPAIFILFHERERFKTNYIFNVIGKLLFWLTCKFRGISLVIKNFIDNDIGRTSKVIWILLFLQLLYLGVYFIYPSFKKWFFHRSNNIASEEKEKKEQDILREMEYYVNLDKQRETLMDSIPAFVWRDAYNILDAKKNTFDEIAIGEGASGGADDILKIYLNAKDYSNENAKSFTSISNYPRGIKSMLEMMREENRSPNREKKIIEEYDEIKFYQNEMRFFKQSREEQMRENSIFNKAFRKIKSRYKKIREIGEKMYESKLRVQRYKRDLTTSIRQKSKPYVFLEKPHSTKERISLENKLELKNGDVKDVYDINTLDNNLSHENQMIQNRAKLDLSKNTFLIGPYAHEYCIGMWIYVHGDTRKLSKSNKDLMNFYNKPRISYDSGKNQLELHFAPGKKFTIKNIHYQKWNYLVVNVKNSRIDIFMNNKLMDSETRESILQDNSHSKNSGNTSILYLGENEGHPIEICNLVYYHIPLTLQEIESYYYELKDKDVPVF